MKLGAGEVAEVPNPYHRICARAGEVEGLDGGYVLVGGRDVHRRRVRVRHVDLATQVVYAVGASE